MEREAFLDALSKLGYPLVKIKRPIDANKILAEVVESREPRLWQGFPIVLANSLKQSDFSYHETLSAIDKEEDKRNFLILVNMSLALYKYLEISVNNIDELHNTSIFEPELFNKLLDDFEQGKEMHVLSNLLSPGGLVNTFRNYSVPENININIKDALTVKEYVNMKEEFDLDFALSQLFSKKQQDLLLKKLRGEKMTKTEREYFSRVVKKKILAVANPDLHRLAGNLIKD